MAAPHEVLCPGCQAHLGYETSDALYWTCACGRSVRRDGPSRVRDVSPEFLAGVKEVETFDRDCADRLRPYRIKVGASKSVEGRPVDPTSFDPIMDIGCIFIILVAFVFCSLVEWGYGWTGLIGVLSLALLFGMVRQVRRKRKAWRALKAEQRIRREALLKEIHARP